MSEFQSQKMCIRHYTPLNCDDDGLLPEAFCKLSIDFKWLLWDSELGWRIIMRCYSEWQTIPDKQRKIYLAQLGFEPTTFGLLVRCSTNWAIGQVGSWLSNDGTWAIWYFETDTSFFNLSRYSFDDQLPTWPVAQLVEHRTSKPKVAGSNPSRAK